MVEERGELRIAMIQKKTLANHSQVRVEAGPKRRRKAFVKARVGRRRHFEKDNMKSIFHVKKNPGNDTTAYDVPYEQTSRIWQAHINLFRNDKKSTAPKNAIIYHFYVKIKSLNQIGQFSN